MQICSSALATESVSRSFFQLSPILFTWKSIVIEKMIETFIGANFHFYWGPTPPNVQN